MTENFAGYDVFGDVHGQAELLERTLTRLGYKKEDGVWRHAERQALFLGDLIDRGPESLRTCRIVRSMVESGAARCLMGNHEYNAICFFTPDPDRPGEFLRKNFSDKNRRQHGRFLAEVGYRTPLHAELVAWFKTLPLWLELDGLCLVHACWSERAISHLAPRLKNGVLTDELYVESARQGTPARTAIHVLCKGPERRITAEFLDKDGNPRVKARVCWWLGQPGGDRAFCMRDGGQAELTELREPLDERWPLRKPVLFGHYWLKPDEPAGVFTPRAACLDHSAGKGGPLTVYRFDVGDTELSNEKFVSVRP